MERGVVTVQNLVSYPMIQYWKAVKKQATKNQWGPGKEKISQTTTQLGSPHWKFSLFLAPLFANTPSDPLPHLPKLRVWNKQTRHHDLNQGWDPDLFICLLPIVFLKITAALRDSKIFSDKSRWQHQSHTGADKSVWYWVSDFYFNISGLRG